MLLAGNFLMAITAQAMKQPQVQRYLRISNIFRRQLCLVMDFCCKASAYLACMLVSPERSNPHRFPLLRVIKLFCPLLCHNQRVHIGHSQMSANKSCKEHGSKWPAKRTRLIELPTQVCSLCTQLLRCSLSVNIGSLCSHALRRLLLPATAFFLAGHG